uniref:Leucine-rich repeat and WD repeat-containing protein 1 n=1 Tax=Callorhinchus milii TaxID=7868 RepID=A0A4W3J809_CALMI
MTTRVTRELLLAKGTPKCAHLRHVKKIDLSNLQLSTSDLDPRLLSQMTRLKELNVSGNLLSEIPPNLGLVELRVLNCANNQLEDIMSLSQFPHLEDLIYEDNLYLTISDHYKMMYMLSNLQRINGKDITSSANHLRFVNSRELMARVTSFWEKNYKDQFSDPPSPEEIREVGKAFVKSAVAKVNYGPNSLREFTKWRVGSFVSLSNYWADDLVSLHANEVTVPMVKGGGLEICFSPHLQTPIALEPLHFLQSHSKNNNPDDFSTQLWACAFEPESNSTQILGIFNTTIKPSMFYSKCQAGRNLRREFFSLAWTTLTVVDKGHRRKLNILAVGGRKGVVKLIHTRVNYCYGQIKAHKKPISTLCFNPKRETFLFTGSYDESIILWDIGVPDCDYNFKVSQLLTLKVCSTPLRVSLVPTCPDQYLVAASDNGCFAWDITLSKRDGKRQIEMEFVFPIYEDEDADGNFHMVDSLAFCNQDLVASKNLMQGSIYLWSWSRTLKARRKQSKKVNAVILWEMEWSKTDVPYISLFTCPEENRILCGDEKGDVWMYELPEFTKEEKTSGTKFSPTQILQWPAVRVQGNIIEGSLINSVTTDPGFRYLIAITDKNIIAIWKRT